MDMRTQFPSKFWSAHDFDAQGTTFTITNVRKDQVGAEFKPVMYFKGQEKGFVINQGNNKILMSLPGFGFESNGWVGKKVTLYTYMAMFNGQPQPRLGVRQADTEAPVAKPVEIPKYSAKEEMNDEVPW